MEYGYRILAGGETNELSCCHCQNEQFTVKGKIKYAFFILQYLPFVPLKREVILTCNQCQNVHNNALESNIVNDIKKRLFKFYIILPMFTGLILSLLAIAYWQYGQYQERVLTQEYLSTPYVNDFYFINNQKLLENQRPNQNYRLAKIVSIGNNVVSLVYARFTFQHKNMIKQDIQSGMVIDSRYFAKKQYLFTFDKLQQLLNEEAILLVKRPQYNRLYGNLVIDNTVKVSKGDSLGQFFNNKGEAFMRISHLQENINNARKYFLKSAEIGYTPGQINLSRWYINDAKIDQALYWLKLASYKGDKTAINLYLVNCPKVEECDGIKFSADVTALGFSLMAR
ncbi:sel1 repeat family protein [Colwellia piezophila]|uniref:sel1 repeat family protein n=1 Tax=Colwellia piezophila TaxID=211668 RepID=UPI00035CEA76|nr:sel1 repeat family protein [Colwellia piezophila]